MASAGLTAVGEYRLPWIGIRAGTIYNASLGIGDLAARLRGDKPSNSSQSNRASAN
jgi:hypothetical protein